MPAEARAEWRLAAGGPIRSMLEQALCRLAPESESAGAQVEPAPGLYEHESRPAGLVAPYRIPESHLEPA